MSWWTSGGCQRDPGDVHHFVRGPRTGAELSSRRSGEDAWRGRPHTRGDHPGCAAAAGIKFADASGEYDLADFASQVRVSLGYALTEQETVRFGKRSKRGLLGKVLARYSGGGAAPYGLARHVERSETELDIDGILKRLGVRFFPSDIEGPIVQ